MEGINWVAVKEVSLRCHETDLDRRIVFYVMVTYCKFLTIARWVVQRWAASALLPQGSYELLRLDRTRGK